MMIPEPRHGIVALIDQHHEALPDDVRDHMGCSELGHVCDRWLWLKFRWAVQPKPPGRVRRIFRRGNHEEDWITSDLRAIGLDLRHTGASQMRVTFGGHIGGSLDGIAESGVPEAPKKRHVVEFKTHSLKSFEKLVALGVEKSHPLHYVQMQLYMHGTKIDRALYVAVCKNDDQMHTERVRYDQACAEKYLQRGERLTVQDTMPEPLSTDPSWYQCKICDGHDFCHGSKLSKHVNCRTCAHVTPKPDGNWRCERHEADGIPADFQRAGCDSHVLHPDLVPWKLQQSTIKWVAKYEIDGKSVANGEPDAHIYSSREIVANPSACANADNTITDLRTMANARIIG